MGINPTRGDSNPHRRRLGSTGSETLAAIERYAAERLEYLRAIEEHDFDEEELAEEDEKLVDVKDSSDGTVVIKKCPVGKTALAARRGGTNRSSQEKETV